jgi:hypothetical protein
MQENKLATNLMYFLYDFRVKLQTSQQIDDIHLAMLLLSNTETRQQKHIEDGSRKTE